MKRMHFALAVAACLGVGMTTVYTQQRGGGGGRGADRDPAGG